MATWADKRQYNDMEMNDFLEGIRVIVDSIVAKKRRKSKDFRRSM
jgi:hypothetical protein